MSNEKNTKNYDVIVVGAGAAGLHAAAHIGQRGFRTVVLDHAKKPAEKVRISGGGRCNFTNMETEPARFLSNNPHFAKSALARYTPWDFMDQLARHGISWHEKTLGQLFSDGRSQAIIDMLLAELKQAKAELWLETSITDLEKTEDGFRLETSKGTLAAKKLVIASGGLSIPKMGSSGFAYDIARRFDHNVITPRPALVPFTFSGQDKEDFASISGVACDVIARTESEFGRARFHEAMLFTHRGLSGPAILQASSYWQAGQGIDIDLLAGADGASWLLEAKQVRPKRQLKTELEQHLPKRLVDLIIKRYWPQEDQRLNEIKDEALTALAEQLSHWTLKPTATEGWRTAEVTAGGIDTNDLSSKTMESKKVPGLYFIGECVDVTGWLGGYNFQWAWSSAWACAQAI